MYNSPINILNQLSVMVNVTKMQSIKDYEKGMVKYNKKKV